MIPHKTILITGATSGIGKLCAEYLHECGYKVYGAGRRGGAGGEKFEMLKMDVNSDESVNEGVRYVIDKEGALDVVINCAGYGVAGAVEDTSIEEAKAQFDTNFFGVMRVCRAALPHFRGRGGGMIINISSLGGLVSAPFHGLYCASKFAVEGFTEALRMEVASSGVKVVLVEPGDFKTGFTGSRCVAAAAKGNSAYKDVFDCSMTAMEKSEMSGPEPVAIAKLMRKIIETPNPRLRYSVAPGAQALVPFLKRFLPGSVVEKILMSHFGLKK